MDPATVPIILACVGWGLSIASETMGILSKSRPELNRCASILEGINNIVVHINRRLNHQPTQQQEQIEMSSTATWYKPPPPL